MNKAIIAAALILALAYVWTVRYQITNVSSNFGITRIHDTWTGKIVTCIGTTCDKSDVGE